MIFIRNMRQCDRLVWAQPINIGVQGRYWANTFSIGPVPVLYRPIAAHACRDILMGLLFILTLKSTGRAQSRKEAIGQVDVIDRFYCLSVQLNLSIMTTRPMAFFRPGALPGDLKSPESAPEWKEGPLEYTALFCFTQNTIINILD
jgi:hypothetical protein